jgi:dihydrodipicolinate synthase/N-acetylneuraminate lyase
MKTLPNLMPALVTPFDSNGDIDLVLHRYNVEYLTGEGLAGFVIGGSTGEGPYLEPGERSTLVAEARDVAPDAFLLCGINGETVRSALAQIEEAVAAGADAVLVITPTSMVRGRDSAVEGFFFDVADAASLPVYLYTVPKVTGYELPIEPILSLSAHPTVAGMKDSGGNPDRVKELAGALTDPFDMFIGASRAVAAGIAYGAHGAITASANYCWPLLTKLVAVAAARDDAATLQETLDTLTGAIEPFGLPATKAAAEMVGIRPGYPRRPLRPLHPSQHPVVEEALRAAGLTN